MMKVIISEGLIKTLDHMIRCNDEVYDHMELWILDQYLCTCFFKARKCGFAC